MRNVLLLLFLYTFMVNAQVDIIVFDVGAAHCSLIKLPQDKYVIFDAGSQFGEDGKLTLKKLLDEIPEGHEIEAMIISHSDADHLRAANEILDYYAVKKVIHTGYAKKRLVNKPKSDYSLMLKALKRSINEHNTAVINLNREKRDINSGDNFVIGNARFDFLCGFYEPRKAWNLTEKQLSKKMNSVSIVMKFTYDTTSVLFTGDAVGRYNKSPTNTLIATEKYLVENKSDELNVHVVIAPHHGADNGSSAKFCELTSPQYVIFPCGKDYNHPLKQTVDRYIKFGHVQKNHFFRTDRGEGWISGKSKLKKYYNADHTQLYEWNGQAIKGCKDVLGDDDIIIKIGINGELIKVDYVGENICK